jgi:hypothetical protein
VAASIVALWVAVVGGWIWHLSRDPAVVLLRRSASGARWLRIDRPFEVGSHQNVASVVTFAAGVYVPAGAPVAAIDVAALGRLTVWVDQKRVADGRPVLSAGYHLVRVDVVNDNGPSLVRVDAPALSIPADAWRASDDGGRSWVRAVPADESWEPALAPQIDPPWRDLLRLSPVLVGLTVIGTFALLRRPTAVDWGRRVRWVVLGGWVVLAINNITKVPLAIGYDVDSHYQYIRYVAEHLRLPPANGGWQFFQAPLYYIVSAGLERAGVGAMGLRVVPLLCGMAVAELSYRSARIVFPGRGDLQAVAVAVGGWLPVNLYMAQVVSNEPMAAATAGIVVCGTLSLLNDPKKVRSTRHLVGLGAALGFAWLTKVSGLVWTVPVAGALLAAMMWGRPGWPPQRPRVAAVAATPVNARRDWARLALVPAVALLVSGWYFIRNQVQVGRPFFRESSVQALRWWQDPGYRVPSNLVEFGHVFARPIYNGLGSVWDSLYGSLWANGIPSGQTPWNFGLMGAGLWLGLIPTALIGLGIAVAVVGRSSALRFAAASVGLFVAAIVSVYLTLPIYSCAKASYALGTAPCVALLAAAGFDLLRRWRWVRAVVGGMVFCWAVVAYVTYFVVT